MRGSEKEELSFCSVTWLCDDSMSMCHFDKGSVNVKISTKVFKLKEKITKEHETHGSWTGSVFFDLLYKGQTLDEYQRISFYGAKPNTIFHVDLKVSKRIKEEQSVLVSA